MMNREIPIFFTIDDSYAPFLAVALNSAIKNSDPQRGYKAIVLYQDLGADNISRLQALQTENFKIELMPIRANMEALDDRMSNRLRCDYFTLTIYFRLFIPSMFPQYDKGIYIDTEIRPFPETSFKYPAKLNKSVIAMTVTYRKSKVFKRPVMEVYLDGPYYATEESVKERTKSLHDQVYDVMKKRSKNSNVEYIQYRKKENVL